MPPTSVSYSDITELFEDVKREAKNFTEFNPELIIKNPRRLLILRLILGLSQNEFEKVVGLKSKNTSKYERGLIKTMMPSTAYNYIDKILPKIKNKTINKKLILKNFNKMVKESSGYLKANQGTKKVLMAQRKGAINSLKKRKTRQEADLYEKIMNIGIEPQINFALDTKKAIITDIFIKEKSIAIECKDLETNSYREYKEQIRRLAYQGYRIRFYFPKIQLMAFVKSKFKLSDRDKEELKGPFYEVFTNVDSLTRFLK